MNAKDMCSLIGASSETTSQLVGVMEDGGCTFYAVDRGRIRCVTRRSAYIHRLTAAPKRPVLRPTSPQIVRFAPPVGLVVCLAHACHARRLYTAHDILAWNSDLSA